MTQPTSCPDFSGFTCTHLYVYSAAILSAVYHLLMCISGKDPDLTGPPVLRARYSLLVWRTRSRKKEMGTTHAYSSRLSFHHWDWWSLAPEREPDPGSEVGGGGAGAKKAEPELGWGRLGPSSQGGAPRSVWTWAESEAGARGGEAGGRSGTRAQPEGRGVHSVRTWAESEVGARGGASANVRGRPARWSSAVEGRGRGCSVLWRSCRPGPGAWQPRPRAWLVSSQQPSRSVERPGAAGGLLRRRPEVAARGAAWGWGSRQLLRAWRPRRRCGGLGVGGGRGESRRGPADPRPACGPAQSEAGGLGYAGRCACEADRRRSRAAGLREADGALWNAALRPERRGANRRVCVVPAEQTPQTRIPATAVAYVRAHSRGWAFCGSDQ